MCDAFFWRKFTCLFYVVIWNNVRFLMMLLWLLYGICVDLRLWQCLWLTFRIRWGFPLVYLTLFLMPCLTLCIHRIAVRSRENEEKGIEIATETNEWTSFLFFIYLFFFSKMVSLCRKRRHRRGRKRGRFILSRRPTEWLSEWGMKHFHYILMLFRL